MGTQNFATTDTDAAGNVSVTSAAQTVTVATVAPATPTILSLVASPSSGDLDAGKTVTLTLNLSEAVTVAGGNPTLTLNDGGTATYTGGSGTSALTFSYTVGAGQNTAGLTVTAVNLNAASITGEAGNFTIANSHGAVTAASLNLVSSAVNLSTYTGTLVSSLAGNLNNGSTDSTITTVGADGTSYDLVNSHSQGNGFNPLVVTTVVMVDGIVTSININGQIQGSGGGFANAIVQSASNQEIVADNAFGLTDADLNLPAANLSIGGLTQSGPQIDTTAPAAPVITSDTINGNTVTLSGTAEANSTIDVFDGSTALGTATANGSGAWNYITGALTNGLQVFTVTATDAAGNTSAASNVVNALIGQSGAPIVSSLVESPASGDLDAGKTVTLTLNLKRGGDGGWRHPDADAQRWRHRNL